MPPSVERAYHLNRADLLERYKVGMCLECGCCAYVCPAKRKLVQVMQLSNNMLRQYKNEQKAAAEEKAAKEAKKDG